ncbi:TauD-domain-containing protein [Basidiobolus meristosporus CBS 931.73]|uniref:TauD-domain-containing protein n=1 Tax=Basidiobolus meristosporus CBS 931.73 TaxID=1314790 RepID=A0A1Y1Y965_9FUNG|nr:TauD-domain-containing protein [Basidiobolus meristosporus CBS 931.73]|eukprot:ORX94560.1 TauD-domain-containing protein [Basidiobolus meristosporus CBS 931.73]
MTVTQKEINGAASLNSYRNPEYIQGFNAHPERKNLLDAAANRTDLTPSIGTELEGLQLAKLTDAQVEDLLALVAERGVVFLRNQDFSQEEELAFGRRLGQLHIHPFIAAPDSYPEIVIPSGEGRTHPQVDNIYRKGYWHTDISFEEYPASFSILQLKQVPTTGGDTLWSNSYALYDKLSPEFQRFLEGLTGVHSGEVFIKLSDLSSKPLAREIPVNTEHPLIRTNPLTNQKGLFVNAIFTKAIKELNPIESDIILNYLFDHLHRTHEAQVRWTWSPNSVAIWDNRSTQHNATPDYYPYHRYGERITVLGEKPYFDPSSTTEAAVKAPQIEALLEKLKLGHSL